MSARVEWIEVVGDPDVWRSIGLVVGVDGHVPLIGTGIRIVEPDESDAVGIVGWALSGIDPDLADVDGSLIDGGLVTRIVGERRVAFAHHDIGASALDHVVVMTDDLERTTGAITAATGCELKRVRAVGAMRQGFHRIGAGGLIVEVVERPDAPVGPASFWGLVINVDDLDAACMRIGEGRVSAPKDAVQPGRRIATVSSDIGLGLPVALMTV